MRNGKRIEQGGLGKGEDRCIGANTHRKRRNRDCRDALTLCEHTQAVTHILEDRRNPQKCSRLSLALFEERSIAKLAPSCASCILSANALANKPLSQEF